MSEAPLSGCTVLVTRPVTQAPPLCDAIKAAGGEAIRFPAIRIEPRPAVDIAGEIATLPVPDILVFVSRNAVDNGATHFDHYAGD
ncbi:MAG: uroporphyrinogen-III synthase, partial [Woeseiaceae bacterium]